MVNCGSKGKPTNIGQITAWSRTNKMLIVNVFHMVLIIELYLIIINLMIHLKQEDLLKIHLLLDKLLKTDFFHYGGRGLSDTAVKL